MKCLPVLGLRLGPKSEQTFFLYNRNFIAVQGTLRFAQSPLRGLAIT